MIVCGSHAVFWAIALMALLASTYTDVKDRIIPNELVGLAAGCGLALSLITRPELAWIGALAAVLALFALGTLAHHGLIGGGDVKMIAAVTLLFHPTQIGTLLLFIVMAGGVLSCIYIAARYALQKCQAGQNYLPTAAVSHSDTDRQGWLAGECARIATGGPMPYGVAIFAGVAGLLARETPRCLPADFCFF
jgi:prepilin peptidase CpaA